MSNFNFDPQNILSPEDKEQAPEPQIAKNPRQKQKKKQTKNDRLGSKTAPAVQDLEEDSTDYIGTYNYYMYYNSLKPKDPRLPKPTYQPKPDLGFIKESRVKDEEDHDQEKAPELESLNFMMNNLSLNSNSNQNQGQNSPFLQSNFLNDSQGEIHRKTSSGKNQEKVGALENYFGEGGWKGEGEGVNSNIFKTPYQNPLSSNVINSQNMSNVSNILPNYQQMPKNNITDWFNGGGKRGGNSMQGNQNGFQNSQNILGQYYNNLSMNNLGIYQQNQMNMGYNIGNEFGNMMNNGSYYDSFNNIKSPIWLQQYPPLNSQYPLTSLPPSFPNGPQFPSQFRPKNPQNRQKKQRNPTAVFQKSSFPPEISAEELLEKALELSKDHNGSRLVQKKYEEGNAFFRAQIFERLRKNILELAQDVFGNYVVQKILQGGEREKVLEIFRSLEGKIYDMSVHMYGCRVVQEMIGVVGKEEVEKVRKELNSHYSTLIEDQNGNHVVQKLIDRLDQGQEQEITYIILSKLNKFCTHQYGCRVIQKLFEKMSMKNRSILVSKIFEFLPDLFNDQYGNYVIQFILENQSELDVKPVYDALAGRVYDMSVNKFASNVIEKALTNGSREQRERIINEIIKKDTEMQESLLTMVKDKYGNYVVQKLIEFSDEKTKNLIVQRIITSQSLKKKEGFSKHVINFIEKLGYNKEKIQAGIGQFEQNQGKN